MSIQQDTLRIQDGCVVFVCSDCENEILEWIPRLSQHPERLGWCDGCWQARQSKSVEQKRRAA